MYSLTFGLASMDSALACQRIDVKQLVALVALMQIDLLIFQAMKSLRLHFCSN